MTIVVALQCVLPTASTHAQTAITGSALENVSGSAVGVSSADGGGTTWAPTAVSQTVVTLALVQVRPRSLWAADLRMTLALDPATRGSLQTSDPSASSLSSVFHLQPELGLLSTLAPTETLRLGLFARGQANLNLSSAAQSLDSGASDPGTSESGTTAPGTTVPDTTEPGTGETGGGGSASGSLTGSGLLARLARLPDNTAWMEAGLSFQPLFGERWSANVLGSYRYLQPFACQGESTLDPALALTHQDVQTSTFNVNGQLTHALREHMSVSALASMRVEDSLPWEACPESTVSPSRYLLFTPGVGLDMGFEEGGLRLAVGATGVRTRSLLPGGTSETPSEGASTGSASEDLRPQLMLDGHRRFYWGQLTLRAGAEVVTLLGQSTPTYNRLVEVGGRWELNPRWSLHSGLGLVRTLPLSGLSSTDSASTSGVDTGTADATSDSGAGMRALTAQLDAAWMPEFWFRMSLGYTLTSRQVVPQSVGSRLIMDRLEGAQPGDSTGEIQGVLIHAVFANISMTFDPRNQKQP